MKAATNTAERSSVALAVDDLDKRFGPQWLRWPLGAVLVLGSGGAGVAAPAFFGDPPASERDLDKLAQTVAAQDSELARIADETDRAYAIGVLALEISVSGHKELTRLIVEVAKLDHPDFDPLQDDQLNTRLIRGGQLLQTLSAPSPRHAP